MDRWAMTAWVSRRPVAPKAIKQPVLEIKTPLSSLRSSPKPRHRPNPPMMSKATGLSKRILLSVMVFFKLWKATGLGVRRSPSLLKKHMPRGVSTRKSKRVASKVGAPCAGKVREKKENKKKLWSSCKISFKKFYNPPTTIGAGGMEATLTIFPYPDHWDQTQHTPHCQAACRCCHHCETKIHRGY